MKAERIVWQWCSLNISPPPQEIQTYVQNMAIGVIHAHQGGNMSPIDDRRDEEVRKEGSFDPAKETGDPEELHHKRVRDCIFTRVFERMLVHVEVFYCWNSVKMPTEKGASEEWDTGCYYLVEVGEILSAPPILQLPEDSPQE